MPKLKLISFELCPYVQRARCVLHEKNMDYDIEFIDLQNKPDWFLKLSPLGKVPILIVDDNTVVFESHVICELLDEMSDNHPLMPQDSLLRAHDRQWFSYIGAKLNPSLYHISVAKDQEALDTAVNTLKSDLQTFERLMQGREYLSGDGGQFGMADVGATSTFAKIMQFKRIADLDILKDLPNCKRWADSLVARQSVINAWPEHFDDLAKSYSQKVGAALVAH